MLRRLSQYLARSGHSDLQRCFSIYPSATIAFTLSRMNSIKCVLVTSLIALVACGPSEKERAVIAEQRRIDCLDKFCQGDLEPKRNMATEVALKLNGEWYVGPKEYFSTGKNGGGFYWPSKHPMFRGGNYPEGMQEFPSKAIEIFLTGRQRWALPQTITPWNGRGWEGRFDELQKQGLHILRKQLTPELERVSFIDTQGKQYRHEYFLLTQQRNTRGDGLPGVACDLHAGATPNSYHTCTGADFWQEDVFADFRFHVQHAEDWPAIHAEVLRVINLLKKVQPGST